MVAALGLSKPDHRERSFADDMMHGVDAIGNGIVNGLGMFLDNLTAQVRGMGKRSVGDMFEHAPAMDPKFNPRGARSMDIESPKLERKAEARSPSIQKERGISQEQAQRFDGMLAKYGMDKASLEAMSNPNQVASLKDQQMAAQMHAPHQPMRFEFSEVSDSFVPAPTVGGPRMRSYSMGYGV